MKTVFLDFDSLHPQDLSTEKLDAQLEKLTLWPDTAPEELASRLTDTEVVVVNKIRLERKTLESAGQLKLICLAATGTDNVDLDAAQDLNIAVCNIREYCTPSVVQHVFALILELTQHLQEYRLAAQDGTWQASNQFCLLEPPIRELQGKTLGVIGLGALGSGVTGVARAFGMRVIAARLPWRSTQEPNETGQSAPRVQMHELLQQSDVVTLHCPLNEDTHHLIDADALEQMKSDALLINTARGGLVDSAALLAALQNEDIGGAGIDVLEQEPPVNGHPLIDTVLPNLVVTPHIAWSAQESRQRALDEILANIAAFSAGEARNRVC